MGLHPRESWKQHPRWSSKVSAAPAQSVFGALLGRVQMAGNQSSASTPATTTVTFSSIVSTLEQEPPLLKWTRQHYDVARVVISRMSWTSRRKLASSSIELRRTVDKARKDGKCTTRLLLQVRKVEHPPQKVVTPQLLGAGFGDTMQVTALDPESKVPIARTTPDGPAALQRYGCATMDGRLYVAGGHDFNWYVASLQVLDLGTGTWKSSS